MIHDSASFSGPITAAPLRPRAGLEARARGDSARPTVLHFIPGIGGGGAEAMLLNLAETLPAGAWRTVVVAVDARPWPRQAERLRELNVTLHDLASPAFLRPATLTRLRRIIRAEKPDVVQTWMHHADFVGGLAARLAGVRRVVWSIHCREIHRNPGDSDLKIRLFRRALSLASRVVPSRIISCSEAAIEDHATLGYPRNKMNWIPNGISPDRFAPNPAAGAATRRELGLPDGAPVIGFAGRFHPMKQLGTFLRAAAELGRRMPHAHFVLCGGTEPDFDADAASVWSAFPHKDRVRFAPFRADMERFYPALSLFSLSSRTEAWPMTLLEAMACGVPCAATDVGDCRALLGDAAFVAPVGDGPALARVWERTLANSGDGTLGTALRRRVNDRFTITRAADHYASTYRALLADRA